MLKAKEKGTVKIFDRAGYHYHGRVKIPRYIKKRWNGFKLCELNIDQQSDLIEKVIGNQRVTKNQSEKLHFSALVVVGDTKGRVGSPR